MGPISSAPTGITAARPHVDESEHGFDLAPADDRNTARSSFDVAHSLKLDACIIDIEHTKPGLRRSLLRLRKRILERHVPAWNPEVR